MKIPRRRNDWSTFTPDYIEDLIRRTPPSGIGYLIWTKIEPDCLMRGDFVAAQRRVDDTITALERRGIRRVALGVSWCDWVTWEHGKEWIRWYVRRFAERFDVLPRITYTPPALTENGTINDPPVRPLAFAEFLDELLTELGNCFGSSIELWNEYNLDTDWLREKDPDYSRFLRMIMTGALAARVHGKQVLLGGMAGITTKSIALLSLLARRGLCRYVDAIGFHDLRGTWGDTIPSAAIAEQVTWIRGVLRTPPSQAPAFEEIVRADLASAREPLRKKLRAAFSQLRPHGFVPQVWLTEYGFPAIDPYNEAKPVELERMQAALFAYAVACLRAGDVERVYWYTLRDHIGESVRKHTTGFEDPLQWHYGDTCIEGNRRLLGMLLEAGGEEDVLRYVATHRLFPLVDAASFRKRVPPGYKRNVFSGS